MVMHRAVRAYKRAFFLVADFVPLAPAASSSFAVSSNDALPWSRWIASSMNGAALRQIGAAVEFHEYPGLAHGFGSGEGTAAEGWIDAALQFWLAHR